MKRMCALFAALLLALTACGSASSKATYQLYFQSGSATAGAALTAQPVTLDPEPDPTEALIKALLDGPSDPNLLSPFPRGVSLRSWSEEDGLLHINLSEAYGGLSGMALTLADYSITLTLCQLDEVEGVSITVENDPMPFRYRQTLTAEDILLSDLLTVPAA